MAIQWKTGLISQGPCQLEYKFTSHPGKPWMVFLHGFGQDFRAFEPMYTVLNEHFSFLSLNLFFHGESSLEGTGPLLPEDWKVLIEDLFEKLEIDKALWMAYSMGAKFTLTSYQLVPQLFSGITILAPDGVVMNPWYGFATQNAFGRFCLSASLRYIPLFRYLVILLGRIGVVRPSLGKFATGQLATRESRKLVLDVWLRFRKIWPTESIWRGHLKKDPIPVMIVLGKYDTIMSKKKFQKKREEWKEVQWLELDAGHASLVEKFASKLAKQL